MIVRIGALSIGQSPRPDLLEPLQQMLPDYKLVERGALDDLTESDLSGADQAQYPLGTRMRDGKVVMVDEAFLSPLVQNAVDWLEAHGVVATILLCAGPFAAVHSNRPLFNPFDIACSSLHSLGIRQIGVVCPVAAQRFATERKWLEKGFMPTVWVVSPDSSGEQMGRQLAREIGDASDLQCLVLDYVGYTRKQLNSVQSAVSLPVLDLGYFTVSMMAPVLMRIPTKESWLET